jgi:hypothetical protein
MVERRWSAAQIEATLRELKGVCGARVVADEKGLIQEIHLLVENERNPKQVVRDVESALMAHFGISVDHRKISVAQKGRQPFGFQSAPALARCPNLPGGDAGNGMRVFGAEWAGLSGCGNGCACQYPAAALGRLCHAPCG